MAEKIIMPQGGQDIMEGRVLRWHKAEGDPVQKDEVICEVETEKAVFEVKSPIDGVLLKIVVPEGKVAQVFSAIGYVGAAGESVAVEADDDEAPVEKKEAKPEKKESGVDLAALKKKVAAKGHARKGRTKASGRAKKLADQHGIDMSLVEGTGPKGRIVEKDVQAYIDQGPAIPEAAPAAPAAAAAPAAPPAGSPALRGQTVPMTRMRQVIARRLQQSKQTIPHFYVTLTVDMTEAIQQRTALNTKLDKDSRVSMNDMVVKAAAIALGEFPQVNCKIDEDNLIYLEDINIGVAVGLDDGLVVPVLAEVDNLSLKGIAKKTKELVNLAKAGKQASLTSGTFTISNMGMLDVDNFVAIINPPESAILAVGSVRKKLVVADDNSFQVRDTMCMTLSADHRAVDGVLGSKFINRIKYGLENPQTLIG
ncbi:Dihydrolipoamide acetyltransferase component of pyruvate dehydrogenase complex (EC [Olavius algarvensis Delta 1 endosymbiont]|nr:Dihydrolipoamide acetyltransferase component of pyruvate dehydrogenase complex (EC [Olavius algarvensis Delta 1 endosymbiont]